MGGVEQQIDETPLFYRVKLPLITNLKSRQRLVVTYQLKGTTILENGFLRSTFVLFQEDRMPRKHVKATFFLPEGVSSHNIEKLASVQYFKIDKGALIPQSEDLTPSLVPGPIESDGTQSLEIKAVANNGQLGPLPLQPGRNIIVSLGYRTPHGGEL